MKHASFFTSSKLGLEEGFGGVDGLSVISCVWVACALPLQMGTLHAV